MTSGLRTYEIDGDLIFELCGEHDIATVPGIEQAIIAATKPQSRIVFDLTECAYADSSMLSMLVRQHRRLGERMTIVVPKDAIINRIVEIAQLHRVIRTVQSVDEAIAEPARAS